MKSKTEFKGTGADELTLGGTISASRGGMACGHKKSAAPIDEPEAPLHFTGQGREYYKYVFNTVVENGGHVLSYTDLKGASHSSVIKRTSGVGHGETISQTIFFQRDATINSNAIIDVLEVESYTKHDNIFASKLTPSEQCNNLRTGSQLNPDEIMNTTPSMKNKEFCDGVNLLTVTASHPDVIEDSYLISDRAANAMHAYGYKRLRSALRNDEFFLNLYGTPENPKYFPSYGEAIRDDGCVMAVRKYDPMFAALDMSVADTQEFSTYYDNCYHADADPLHVGNRDDPDTGSRVVDVRVWRNEAKISVRGGVEVNKIQSTDENIRVLDRAAAPLKRYYQDIIQFYIHHLKKSYGKVQFTPAATRMIAEAMAAEASTYSREFGALNLRDIKSFNAVERIYQYSPISHYTVEIVIRYPIPVTVSSKITDLSGTKGIVGAVKPLHEMPLDKFGRYVDVVRSSNAVMRRSTYAGIYHIYWDAASLQMRDKLNEIRVHDLDAAWDMMLSYMCKYNEDWANVLNLTHTTVDSKYKLLDELNDVGVRIYLPIELDKTPMEITLGLGEFTPEKSKLQITNYDGEKEMTKEEFYVGNVYHVRLDKTGREFSSTSSMRTNYLGMVSVALPNERDSRPINDKAIKWGSESERRLVSGYGGNTFDVIHYRANTPEVHYGLVRGLYESMTPSAPGDILNCADDPTGLSRAHELTQHPMLCEGVRFVRPTSDTVK